eukprot:gnl/Trimastix_PCT/3711.p1 GENE.gnl/Trimastix_PCT/3711~~gnl/Trimastix_PCT/3711.p1  ORF type:complete len:295 (-),score=4.85 gnl/Trimastix_PCT/3711:206-1090(-)
MGNSEARQQLRENLTASGETIVIQPDSATYRGAHKHYGDKQTQGVICLTSQSLIFHDVQNPSNPPIEIPINRILCINQEFTFMQKRQGSRKHLVLDLKDGNQIGFYVNQLDLWDQELTRLVAEAEAMPQAPDAEPQYANPIVLPQPGEVSLPAQPEPVYAPVPMSTPAPAPQVQPMPAAVSPVSPYPVAPCVPAMMATSLTPAPTPMVPEAPSYLMQPAPLAATYNTPPPPYDSPQGSGAPQEMPAPAPTPAPAPAPAPIVYCSPTQPAPLTSMMPAPGSLSPSYAAPQVGPTP